MVGSGITISEMSIAVSGKSITMTAIAIVSVISIGIGFRFGIGGSFSHMIDRNGCAGPGSSVRWEWGCATDTIHIINFSGSFSATSPTCG